MDGGPFRSQQPSDRRVVSRPERRQSDEPQPLSPEPAPIYRAAPSAQHVSKEEKRWKKRKFPLLAIIAVILLAIGGWFAWTTIQNTNTGIDTNKYQAVFFTNGQVYFGKLKPFNGGYMQLTDIYYLQTQSTSDDSSDNPQKTTTNQNDVQLIKLGDEIHGPEDQMIISRDQMLFYENLKTDSKVAQSIAQYKSK